MSEPIRLNGYRKFVKIKPLIYIDNMYQSGGTIRLSIQDIINGAIQNNDFGLVNTLKALDEIQVDLPNKLYRFRVNEASVAIEITL